MDPSLSFGRFIVAIPGPSVVPDRVLNAMHRAMPNIYEGDLLAISDSVFADLPTVAEAGLPRFTSLTWNGVLVPSGTPPEIVHRLNREIDTVLRMPDVKARLNTAGLEPVGGSPDAFKALIAMEAGKWAEIIKRTGATLD